MSSGKGEAARNKGKNSKLVQLSTTVAEDVQEDFPTVQNVVRLLESDNTVPFIARYRKQETGNMEVEKIRAIQGSLCRVKLVEERKESVMKAIGERCTPEVLHYLNAARTMQDVEDIYAPFKTGSKGTLANRARKLGLDRAVQMIQENPMLTGLDMFIQPKQKGLSSEREVVEGVQHIIADMVSKDQEMCQSLKNMFENSHITLQSQVYKKSTGDNKYKEYHERTISVKMIKPHQILALNRAEEKKIVHVKMNCPANLQQGYFNIASRKCILPNSSDFVRRLMRSSLNDCYSRLMLPKLMRHKRAELTKKAEKESVQVFSQNLRRLLLTPPVQGRTVLGIDPGFTHGCKLAVVDKNGNILATDVIYPFLRNPQVAENKLQGLLTTHNCNTIALGNGAACRETETFITKMKAGKKLKNDVVYSIVSEQGASIYSISQQAQAEMPQLDVNLRSAVSIARRLQNPLLELIKIEPKHVGVGMYQHDIPEKLLETALSSVLEDCVSLVGVDLNAAGVHALRRIAGLNERKAKEIVAWRERHGPFSSRQQLKKVFGIGGKTFEQCAGFVRVMGPPSEILVLDDDEEVDLKAKIDFARGKRKAGESNIGRKKRKLSEPSGFNRLDSTSIHPESYPVAEKLVALTEARMTDIGQSKMKQEMDKLLREREVATICSLVDSNPACVSFIVTGLCQSIGYDIRADFAKPLFREGVLCMEDIRPNMQLTGRVSNVTPFGAFVDIGVKKDALIHVSKIPPGVHDIIGVGDIVDVSVIRKDGDRISLLLLAIQNSNIQLT